ncbi:uncharacterized protein [Centruroides vittatus]|uniref:uncharacterized protein isoform X2 n=1 Tax=Centruroides vittatus TaxID=120091 RepID=UPI00350F7952
MLEIKTLIVFILLRSVCGTLNTTCDELCLRVVCPETECEDSEKIDNGSVCGCCPVCVTYKEGQSCESEGVSKSLCRPGLICDNGKCSITGVLDDSHCWNLTRLRENLIADRTLSPDAWVPSCNRKYYKPKQCKQHKCFCFENNGERIFGQANKEMDKNMTCGCSLTLFEQEKNSGTAWNTEPHEHCTLNGNYEELQCVGNVCYCSNPISGKHIGQVTLIQNITLLPCYDAEKHRKNYLTKCEEIVQRTQLITHQFSLKGVELIGLKDINCDYDGSFSRKQCLTDKCFCTDRNGKSFKSYSSVKANMKTEMLCNCARDEYDTEFMSAHYPRLECNGNTGNYNYHQTVGKNQFCVDEDGEILYYIEKETNDLAKQCLEKYKKSGFDNDDNVNINEEDEDYYIYNYDF